jgi:hypothetical protein
MVVNAVQRDLHEWQRPREMHLRFRRLNTLSARVPQGFLALNFTLSIGRTPMLGGRLTIRPPVMTKSKNRTGIPVVARFR